MENVFYLYARYTTQSLSWHNKARSNFVHISDREKLTFDASLWLTNQARKMCLLIADMQYYIKLYDTVQYDMIKYQFVHLSVCVRRNPYLYSRLFIAMPLCSKKQEMMESGQRLIVIKTFIRQSQISIIC